MKKADKYECDLIPAYRATKKVLELKREELKQLRNSVKEKSLKLMGKVTLITTLRQEREEIEQEIVSLESDMKTLGEMIRDVEYILEWLETGRRPGNKRGVERLAAYQREKPVDPLKLQAYVANRSSGGAVQCARIPDKELDRIEFALAQLTPRERECYEMVRGNALSYGETAELLGIERGSVQWFVEAADTKLRHHINQADLFDYI